MWKLLFVLALPLAPMAAAHSVTSEDSADVQCQIRAKPTQGVTGGGGIELEAVVASETPLSGTYQFEVRKAGNAGTSSSAQSGDFDAVSGEAVIGHVGLGLEPGATYDAELVVRWNDNEAKCAASGPEA
ncbi:MAG TPA: curli-like amyloid fiber formation chaperone CsgH [Aestuariivirgaceae bacterium]|nr:curli-like amyloid fiber formation chaperone CsgH [Aestuariivirgaceae bacterium]